MDEKTPKYVRTDQQGWIRDTETGAILSVNRSAQKEHKERVEKQRAKNAELNSLKDELSQLKALVNKLVEDK